MEFRHKFSSWWSAAAGAFVFVLWLSWMVCHVFFCLQIVLEDFKLEIVSLQAHLAILLVLNMLVLLHVLVGQRNTSDKGVERRLSLLGGFILGITPLGLAGLGFATSLATVKETLKENPTSVDLSGYHDNLRGRIRVLVGIDASKSFLRFDKKASDAVCILSSRLLTGGTEVDSWMPPIIERRSTPSGRRPRVEMSFYEFDSEVRLVNRLGSRAFSDPWPSELQDEICSRVKKLSISKDAVSQSTDLVSFLKHVKDEAIPALDAGERVVVIVISDFLHDPNGQQDREWVERQVQAISEEIKEAHVKGGQNCGSGASADEIGRKSPLSTIGCSKLAFVALTVPSSDLQSKLGRSSPPLDIRPLLANFLSKYWQEHPLEKAIQEGLTQDLLLLTGVLSTEITVEVRETLYLRYNTSSRNVVGTNLVNMLAKTDVESENENLLALKLRSWPDQGSLPGKLNITFKVSANGEFSKGDARDQSLYLNDGVSGRWSHVRVPPKQNERMQFSVVSPLDLSRGARLELLVAVPGSLLVYAIPVVIYPSPGAEAVGVFKYIIWFFLGCVVVFCLAHFISWININSVLNRMARFLWEKSLWAQSHIGEIYRKSGSLCLAGSRRMTEALDRRFGGKNGL